MSYVSRMPAANRLLASLSAEDGSYIASLTRTQHLPQGRILSSASAAATDLWFPHSGAIALITTDASGRSVQTGLIGREGCVGLQALFGEKPPMPEAVVQIHGAMSAISANHLLTFLDARPHLRIALSRFLYGLSTQALQTIACNRLHSLLSRCCRWLLLMQDEAENNDLMVTQEMLATSLGSGRPRVNLLLASLERDGILRRHRGRIHLLNRYGLERHSCECYQLIRGASELLVDASG